MSNTIEGWNSTSLIETFTVWSLLKFRSLNLFYIQIVVIFLYRTFILLHVYNLTYNIAKLSWIHISRKYLTLSCFTKMIYKCFWKNPTCYHLVCTGAGDFILHRRMWYWYAHAQVTLVCVDAGRLAMCRHRRFWYAQVQDSLVCAGADDFGMRRCKTV